ncbi:hypothetical protein GOP47_0005811 [Adiantum capillus-veneris]|uniref:Uncharacterized protein n=1 Tax=Adiantum capillus-veneris TaxID=13818 RepID=A0A9D4ZNM0_ADICA|nr:hypothetical protein GOP47_0005811 [Adiantum capillus-veneris]
MKLMGPRTLDSLATHEIHLLYSGTSSIQFPLNVLSCLTIRLLSAHTHTHSFLRPIGLLHNTMHMRPYLTLQTLHLLEPDELAWNAVKSSQRAHTHMQPGPQYTCCCAIALLWLQYAALQGATSQ